MNFQLNNNVLTIVLNGRVDTNNADQVFIEIDEIISKQSFNELIIDCNFLEYISSAGLRQILKLRKAYPDICLLNVNSEVYDIFEMTGFTEMMKIKKAYRKISVDGCEIIGQGSNGTVYRINDDTIVKVYFNNDALSDIHRERELARAALVMGINTAISYDVVQVGDHFGSMFELLNNKSITKWIKEDKENIDKYINIFTDMLKEIHATEVTSPLLPSEKEVVLKRIKDLEKHLDKKYYDKLFNLINNIEDSHKMIHGDYHTNNVHYDGKETILIDMDTISFGNPIFEFGNLYNACIGFYLGSNEVISNFLKIETSTLRYIYKKTIELYFGEQRFNEIDQKAKVIGLSRLLRRSLKREADDKEFINLVEKELINALDSVDTLNI